MSKMFQYFDCPKYKHVSIMQTIKIIYKKWIRKIDKNKGQQQPYFKFYQKSGFFPMYYPWKN